MHSIHHGNKSFGTILEGVCLEKNTRGTLGDQDPRLYNAESPEVPAKSELNLLGGRDGKGQRSVI
jgi:hypothetical protein